MLVKIGCDYRTQAEKENDFFPYDDEFQVNDRDFIDYFHRNCPGFTIKEFTENREKIYDIRYCFGFGYSFYDDNVDEFVRIYNFDDKVNTVYNMFYEEIGLIDVEAWFGAEKIFNYLKTKCNKILSLPYLAIFGGNKKIIDDCFKMEMNDYQKARFVVKLPYDLTFKICDKNNVDNIYVYKDMFAPLDVINRIKGVKISGHYGSLDNKYLVSYWYSFIEDNNLDAEYPSLKVKINPATSFSPKFNEPSKLIL